MTSPVSSYFEEGLACFEEGDYGHAIELFTKALRLSLGDLAETHLYRGIAYAYLQAYDKAMDDFNRALRKNPYLADAYNERGNLYRMSQTYDQAIEDYQAAIALDPTHYAAYYNRALAYEKLDRLIVAENDLTQAIALNDAIVACYEARGRVRTKLKKYDDAVQDYEKFLELGGGYEFDNESEIQSLIIALRFNGFVSRFIPARFLPPVRLY